MVGLVRPLREFFKDRVTLQQAEEEIKRALETRERRFLDLMQLQVYQNPKSPYLKLLKHAGCEYGDIERQAQRHGLETTLERLAAEGVYVSAEEFKGKKELRRGTLSMRVSPSDFESANGPGFGIQSSGTSGAPFLASLSLDSLAVRTWGIAIFLAAHDLFSFSHAVYDAALPSGNGSIGWLLPYAKLGISSRRWFVRPVPGDAPHGTIYDRLTGYLLVGMGRWFGPGFALPESVDIRDVGRIAAWASEEKRRGKSCCIEGSASNMVRIARAAQEMGVSLENTKFNAGGEPVTEAKREVVERVGANFIPRYAFTPAGLVGQGCADPKYTDDVHVSEYMWAVIQYPILMNEDAVKIQPLLFTSLYPVCSHLLLNVANGDYATMERRECGCALEKVGLTLHLHGIRSYEKLTAEGMNYLGTDMFELFERILPGEFGGGPGDYQLVEEEDSNGMTRLTVRVSPEAGLLDEEKLLSRVQENLEKGLHTRFWKDAGTFRVEREFPYAGQRGKIWPLHRAH